MTGGYFAVAEAPCTGDAVLYIEEEALLYDVFMILMNIFTR